MLHGGCDLRATCTNCETEKTVYHKFRGSQIFRSISSSLVSKDLKFQWRPRTESAPAATDRRWSSSAPDARAPFPTQCASSSLPIRPATCAPRRSPFPPSKTLITGTRAQIRRKAAVLISRESWIVRLKFGGFLVCRCNTSLLIDYRRSDGEHSYVLIDVGKTFREQVLRWFTRYKIPRVDSVSPVWYFWVFESLNHCSLCKCVSFWERKSTFCFKFFVFWLRQKYLDRNERVSIRNCG